MYAHHNSNCELKIQIYALPTKLEQQQQQQQDRTIALDDMR